MTYIETDKLKNLRERVVDSYDGYNKASETTEDTKYTNLFQTRAAERKRYAQEIGSVLVARGQEFDDDGSLAADGHRFWMSLRAALGDTETALANEIARGEKELLSAYDDVLKDSAVTDPLFTVLSKQREHVASTVEDAERLAA